MSNKSIAAEPRKEFGKNANNRLRSKGLVPINLIGNGESSLGSISEKEITLLVESGIRPATVLELSLGGKTEKVFVKEIQRFPDTGKIRHIDFYKMIPGKKIATTVGITTTGVAKGSKAGGQFTHTIHELKIKSNPEDFIDVLQLDVTELGVGDSIKVSDLKIPKSWEIQVNGNPIIATVSKTKALIAQEREEKKADKAPAKAASKAPAKAPAKGK